MGKTEEEEEEEKKRNVHCQVDPSNGHRISNITHISAAIDKGAELTWHATCEIEIEIDLDENIYR